MVEKDILNIDFFHALNHLLKQSHDLELTTVGQKRLCIRPKDSLCFPVRDVYEVLEEKDKIIITCYFMGLYGVDSPLPMYFNEMCLKDDETGQALRDFLDIFNHRSYSLFFLAWRAFQPEMALEVGECDYFKLIQSVSGYPDSQTKLFSLDCLMKANVARFDAIIQHFIPTMPVDVQALIPSWDKLDSTSSLGSSLLLGDNMVLGERVYSCCHFIRIELGPMDWEKVTELFPEKNLGCHLVHVLRASFDYLIRFELRFLVQVDEACLCLGVSPASLGRQTWLGYWQGGWYSITLPEIIYR